MKNKKTIKIIATMCLILFTLVSVFVISPKANNPEAYSNLIKSIDEKKFTVTEFVGSSATIAVALSAIPGDATTPIANQIARYSSYLIIVIIALFLEKILLTFTVYISFTFLIPICLILLIIFLWTKIEFTKKLAIKLGIFAIIIVLIIPFSIGISDIIDKNYGYGNQINVIKAGIETASDITKKTKELLNYFIDTIAVLIITTCIIPIGVFIFLSWIARLIIKIDFTNCTIKKSKNINVKNGIINKINKLD